MRSVGTRYSSEGDLLSGDGAAKYGGRWNPRGLKAVYGSTDILTATHEAYQNFIEAGFSLSSLKPRVTAGAQVSLSVLLDLSDKNIRRRIGFTLDELLTEPWQAIQAGGEESWTQAIGRGCFEKGFEGLLVPSARNPGGKNLVTFPKSLAGSSSIKILGRKDLPPHPSAWPAK